MSSMSNNNPANYQQFLQSLQLTESRQQQQQQQQQQNASRGVGGNMPHQTAWNQHHHYNHLQQQPQQVGGGKALNRDGHHQHLATRGGLQQQNARQQQHQNNFPHRDPHAQFSVHGNLGGGVAGAAGVGGYPPKVQVGVHAHQVAPHPHVTVGKATPPSHSGSGDESGSSGSGRRDKQGGNYKKTNRPKRRAMDENSFDHHKAMYMPPPGMNSDGTGGGSGVGGGSGGDVLGRPPLWPNSHAGATPPRSNKEVNVNHSSNSSSHHWSSSSEDGNREQDEHRLRQRSKQLNFGKVTVGYKNYRIAVPLSQRQAGNPRHPMTPDASQKCSKRRWDAMVASWRRSLHLWDTNPMPNTMALEGYPTLAELGEARSVPLDKYLRDTEEELQRIASEVASMHSGASSSSQTAGDTSVEDISSNDIFTARSSGEGNNLNSLLATVNSHNRSPTTSLGGSASTKQQSSGSSSAEEKPLEHAAPGAAATYINIVHIPPKSVWNYESCGSLTITMHQDQDGEHLFHELQKVFDVSKLFYDGRFKDFPGTYHPEMFSCEGSVYSGRLIPLDSVKAVNDYLNLSPMLPRLEYHGTYMPSTTVPAKSAQEGTAPGQGKGAWGSAVSSGAGQNQQHGGSNQKPPMLLSLTTNGSGIKNNHGERLEMGSELNNSTTSEVQLTPTRFLLDNFQLQGELMFSTKNLESAPTPTFAAAGVGAGGEEGGTASTQGSGSSKVNASRFFQKNPPPALDQRFSSGRDIGNSPVGTIGPAGGAQLDGIPPALLLESPTKRH